MLRKLVLSVALCSIAATATAQVPSLLVPVVPCRLHDAVLAGDTVHFFHYRGETLNCQGGGSRIVQVPTNATSVLLAVAVVAPEANGNALFWPADVLKPIPASSLNFRSGTGGADSSLVSVRLCTEPVNECIVDFHFESTETARWIWDIVGYTVPLAQE